MKKVHGITLLEMMLVLVIGSFLIMMGLRQYLSYRLDTDVNLIKYNTDALFSAMSSYFQANCHTGSGLLPLSPSPTTVNLNIQNDLITPGYLNANQILDVSLVAENRSVSPIDRIAAYQARFVSQVVPRIRSQQNPFTPSLTYPVTNPAPETPSQYFLIWEPQVMVILQNQAQSSTLQMMTIANSCAQTDWTPTENCNNAPALIFAHQVSFAAHSGTGSNYWTMMPSLGQLRDQEENYGPTVLLPAGSTTEQYYVCGG